MRDPIESDNTQLYATLLPVPLVEANLSFAHSFVCRD